jgi:hypothetical protein
MSEGLDKELIALVRDIREFLAWLRKVLDEERSKG